MVYSINLTYRGSDVNVIRGLFYVAFDFVTIDDKSDEFEDVNDGDREDPEDDEDDDLYGQDEALQQLYCDM